MFLFYAKKKRCLADFSTVFSSFFNVFITFCWALRWMAPGHLAYLDCFNSEVCRIVDNFVQLMHSSKAKFTFSCQPVPETAVFLSFKLYKTWRCEIPLFRTTFQIEHKKDLISLEEYLNGVLSNWTFYDPKDYTSDQDGNTVSDEDCDVKSEETPSDQELEVTTEDDDGDNIVNNHDNSQEDGQHITFNDSD